MQGASAADEPEAAGEILSCTCHDAKAGEQDREQMKNLFIDQDVTRSRKETGVRKQ